MENKIVCQICIEVHGRDTNQPIECRKCKCLIGCYWHKRGATHMKTCKIVDDETSE